MGITWSSLAFAPFTGDENLNDLNVGIQAGLATAEGRKEKNRERNKVYAVQAKRQFLLLWLLCTGFNPTVILA